MEHDLLLREYVRQVLSEDDEGGYNFFSKDDLFNMFVQPFADLGSVFKGELGKTLARVKTTVRIAAELVLNTVVPFHSSRFDEIWKAQKNKIERISSKHKAAYDRVNSAFKEADIVILAFMMSPLSVLTKPFIKSAPGISADLFGFLAGDDRANKFKIVMSQYLEQQGSQDPTAVRQRAFHPPAKHEGLMREGSMDSAIENAQKIMQTSSAAKEAQATARNIAGSYLEAVKNAASEAARATSLDNLPGFNGQVKGLEKMNPDERSKVQQVLLHQAKAAIKNVYAVSLKKQVEQAMKSGIQSDNPLIVAFNAAIEQINQS